jgi:hypothetical protein
VGTSWDREDQSCEEFGKEHFGGFDKSGLLRI